MTTVITCRSLGVMAADSQITHRDSRFKSSKKVQRIGRYLCGVAGDYDPALAFVRRLARRLRTMDGHRVPDLRASKAGEFEVLVMSAHGLWLYAAEGTPIEVECEDYYAIGSGGSCAMASMRTQEILMAPPDLRMAVEVACEHDSDSGLPVIEAKLTGSNRTLLVNPA